MVTFQRIDPFFVIDLSDPKNPEILGELKSISGGSFEVVDTENGCYNQQNSTPPIANFTTNKITGNAPLTVQFTDQSFPSVTSWEPGSLSSTSRPATPTGTVLSS